jgi:hypothetical protein
MIRILSWQDVSLIGVVFLFVLLRSLQINISSVAKVTAARKDSYAMMQLCICESKLLWILQSHSSFC